MASEKKQLKKGLKRRWMAFMTSIFLLTCGIYLIILFARNMKPYQVIKSKEMEADALFYTESPVALEANYILIQKDFSRSRGNGK